MFKFFLLLCSVHFCFAQTFYYANQSVVNVLRYPDSFGEMATQVTYGTEIEILDAQDNWVKIKTPHQFEGWCQEDQIIALEHPYPATEIKAKVNTMWTHLYYVDDTTPHPIAYTLPFDSEIEVISSEENLNDRWMHVKLLDGTILSAIRNDFLISSHPLTLEQMLHLSKTFLHLPYVWAGTSGFGFDCSGFTHMLFKQMGVFIPRNSRLQANFEKFIPIDFNNKQPGDLVFFGKNKISHVGLYLGNNEFIHAFAGDKNYPATIQINSLNQDKWKNILICFRRYPKEELPQLTLDNDLTQNIH